MCFKMFIGSLAVTKKTPLISTVLSLGEVKEGWPGLHGWSLFRSSSNLSKCRYHTFSKGHVPNSSSTSAMGPCQQVAWHCWEVKGKHFLLPYHVYANSVDSTQILYWFKGAWENSDYFPICLVKLLRAVTSEMADKGFLGALQIRMYIWTVMNSQLGPLVQLFQ